MITLYYYAPCYQNGQFKPSFIYIINKKKYPDEHSEIYTSPDSQYTPCVIKGVQASQIRFIVFFFI